MINGTSENFGQMRNVEPIALYKLGKNKEKRIKKKEYLKYR